MTDPDGERASRTPGGLPAAAERRVKAGSGQSVDSEAAGPGRERGLAVGVLGLVIAVVVVAASAHESAVVAHGEKVGIEVEVVEPNLAQSGFVPIPRRWIVERAYGILILHRRLVRDYEHLPRSSRSRVYWAMTAVILRRLSGATAQSWRTA